MPNQPTIPINLLAVMLKTTVSKLSNQLGYDITPPDSYLVTVADIRSKLGHLYLYVDLQAVIDQCQSGPIDLAGSDLDEFLMDSP